MRFRSGDFLVPAFLAAILLVTACATVSPQERAAKECVDDATKVECTERVARREVAFSKCHLVARAEFRQYNLQDGEECRTTGTVVGNQYSGTTTCSPKYKTCNDLRAMEEAFSTCIQGEGFASDDLVQRYRVSLAFFQAANQLQNCPR